MTAWQQGPVKHLMHPLPVQQYGPSLRPRCCRRCSRPGCSIRRANALGCCTIAASPRRL